jgi:hypothetical protein
MNTGPFGLKAHIIALLEPFLKSVHDGCCHVLFSFLKKILRLHYVSLLLSLLRPNGVSCTYPSLEDVNSLSSLRSLPYGRPIVSPKASSPV